MDQNGIKDGTTVNVDLHYNLTTNYVISRRNAIHFKTLESANEYKNDLTINKRV